ncbi:site-specific integrase, partial [Vibrio sp. 10N.261.49.A5]
MIKLPNVDRQSAIVKAQNNVGIYTNYLNDVLRPAIKRGKLDELEVLDIGFSVTGESLGKIGDNAAWRKLQGFFEPNATQTSTIDFTLNG